MIPLSYQFFLIFPDLLPTTLSFLEMEEENGRFSTILGLGDLGLRSATKDFHLFPILMSRNVSATAWL